MTGARRSQAKTGHSRGVTLKDRAGQSGAQGGLGPLPTPTGSDLWGQVAIIGSAWSQAPRGPAAHSGLGRPAPGGGGAAVTPCARRGCTHPWHVVRQRSQPLPVPPAVAAAVPAPHSRHSGAEPWTASPVPARSGGRRGLTFTGDAIRHDGVAREAGAHGRVPDDPTDLLAGPVVCQESGRVSRSVGSDSSRPHVLQPHQAPLSLGFSRQDYWSALSCPPPGDLPDPGIEPGSPVPQADSYCLPGDHPAQHPQLQPTCRGAGSWGTPVPTLSTRSPLPAQSLLGSGLCHHHPPLPQVPGMPGRRRWGGRRGGCREFPVCR